MTSPSPQPFHIRDAHSTSSDVNFILAAWDSTLPFLKSIGAGEMWGDQPFSQREGFTEDIRDIIRKSEVERERDERRILIAEVGGDERRLVGFVMIRDALPYYLVDNAEFKMKIDEAGSELLFIEVLITDHRDQDPGGRCRGAGAALVRAVERRARGRGKEAVVVDAWAANGRGLSRYYEGLGFEVLGKFSIRRKDGSEWVGTGFWKGVGLG